MKSTLLLAAALGAAAFTPPRLFGPPRTRAQALAYARKAVFKADDKNNADTETQVPPPTGSQRAPSSKMMVDSWYDKGTRLSKDSPTAVVESWYDSGVRLTVEEDEEQAPLPAGMSAAAAARSPQLAAAALKSEAEIAEIMARLDTFPTKAGTMYGALVRLCLGHHVWCAAHSELPSLLATLSDVLSEPQPQSNPTPNPDPQFQPAPTPPQAS